MARAEGVGEAGIPAISPALLGLFRAYARRYVGKHFRALRLAREGAGAAARPGPLLVVLNHPSWWDPLVGLLLAERLGDRQQYAVIDAQGLARYRFFAKLGFFGIEMGSRRGAAEFLRVGSAVLAGERRVLWVTAQGEFRDPRERPVRLRSGVAHLARRMERGAVLPLALEYPFWTERQPEALARFGEPIPAAPARSAAAWLAAIEAGLAAAQDALAADAIARREEAFEAVLEGRHVGIGGPYDWWRRARAALRGERFEAAHGAATAAARRAGESQRSSGSP